MSLQVWLPLDGDLHNQGLSSLVFSNTDTSKLTVNSAGKIGKCYIRSAIQTNGIIVSSSTINLSNDISMACWAYVTGCVGDTANGLVTNHSHEHNTGVGITVKQVSSSDYRISCNTGTGSSRTYCSYYGTTNIKNAWHHLALTYSKTNKKLQLWVDGKVEYTLSNYTNSSRADFVRIFDWSTTYNSASYRPAAKLNDVRIYNHCLSTNEIKTIVQAKIIHYPLNGMPTKNGTIEYDISGYHRNGTLNLDISKLLNNSSKRYNKTYYFTNNNTSILLGDLSTYTPTGNFTFNIWFYKVKNELGDNYDTIFGGPSGFELEMRAGGSGTDPKVEVHSWGNSNFSYEWDKWQMLTMIRTTSYTKYYLNGVLKLTGTAGSIPSGNYYIGAWRSATEQNYKGKISDARIYATALSEDDIAELYEMGVPR